MGASAHVTEHVLAISHRDFDRLPETLRLYIDRESLQLDLRSPKQVTITFAAWDTHHYEHVKGVLVRLGVVVASFSQSWEAT